MNISCWRAAIRRIPVKYLADLTIKNPEQHRTFSILIDLVIGVYKSDEDSDSESVGDTNTILLAEMISLKDFQDDYEQLAQHRGVWLHPSADDYSCLAETFGLKYISLPSTLNGVEHRETYICGLQRKYDVTTSPLKKPKMPFSLRIIQKKTKVTRLQ